MLLVDSGSKVTVCPWHLGEGAHLRYVRGLRHIRQPWMSKVGSNFEWIAGRTLGRISCGWSLAQRLSRAMVGMLGL